MGSTLSKLFTTLQDVKPSTEVLSESSNIGRKRTGVPDTVEAFDDDLLVKRARSTPDNLEGAGNEINEMQDKMPSGGPTPSRSDTENGPVQQLVAMFGALVAQGEKAAASLDILISSISDDLLADVVMANIRNLPPECPESEDEEILVNTINHPAVIANDAHIKHLSLLLTNILSQSRPSPEKETGIEDGHLLSSSELEVCHLCSLFVIYAK